MNQIKPPYVLHILPRESMTWKEFLESTPPCSIALDGVVSGAPKFDPTTNHINYNHHDDVVREATMSTAMQVYFAIKGGLMGRLHFTGLVIHIYINDTDQDSSLAVWLIINHNKFEGTQSVPHLGRLITLNDRWDITGGAFPMALDNEVIEQHNWVFRPYADLRKSGMLAIANEQVLSDNLSAIMGRLDSYFMGQSERIPLDTRHTILFDSTDYKIIDEIGGSEARSYLFSHGLDAFISKIATRPDGKFVYSIGKRSRYIDFPVEELYDDLNKLEELDRAHGWNGSDILGGSPRLSGSSLEWEDIKIVVNNRIANMKENKAIAAH